MLNFVSLPSINFHWGTLLIFSVQISNFTRPVLSVWMRFWPILHLENFWNIIMEKNILLLRKNVIFCNRTAVLITGGFHHGTVQCTWRAFTQRISLESHYLIWVNTLTMRSCTSQGLVLVQTKIKILLVWLRLSLKIVYGKWDTMVLKFSCIPQHRLLP
jgi:hypothetical protein